ncbi:MAG: hypothetical protein UHN47_01040 [Lachnospiraceae bacterium]|nr:hypothetical protein [Lachnospiraceae bacterium]
MNKKMRNRITDISIFIVFMAFFGFLLITGEPLYLGDSFQHEMQFVTREPVYALLIQFLRWVSPEHHYWFIIIVQNILAVVTNTIFMCVVRREWKLKWPVLVLFVAILLSPHILTPIASASGMVITNSLLSEGIAYSLYLFYVLYILKAIWRMESVGKDSMLAFFWAVFMSLVRGQFMILILVWFLAMALIAFLQKRWKQIVVFVVMLAIAFVGRGLIVKTYNFCEQGLFVATASGKAMSIANVLYVADREDGEAIEEEDLRTAYYEIFDRAYADGMNYRFSPDGLLARAAHHEDCHDSLNFDYFAVVAKEYVTATTGITVEDYQRMMVEVDKVAASLMAELLPQVLLRYLYNYIAMVMMGLIRSVAFLHPIFNWYSFAIYLIAVILMIYVWMKKPCSKAAPFMALVLLMIMGNVAGTSLMIQCISRYMLYNLPLFYMAGFLLLIDCFDIYNSKRHEKDKKLLERSDRKEEK